MDLLLLLKHAVMITILYIDIRYYSHSSDNIIAAIQYKTIIAQEVVFRILHHHINCKAREGWEMGQLE